MNQKRLINNAILFSFICINFVSTNLHAEVAKQILITAKQQQLMGIKVTPLTSSVLNVSHRLPGEISVPVGQERVISTQQGGVIDSLNVAAGSEVKKGQLLGHIISNDILAPQRDYLQASTQHRLALKSFDRDEGLYKDGIIAERRYLETKSKLEESTALVLQLKQSLRLGGMSDSAINQLEQTGKYSSGLSFTSPMDGQVLEQMVTIGQRVDSTTPLFRIGHLNPLWLEIHAPVDSLSSVTKGLKVKIPQFEAEGKVIAIIRSINKNDQTMHVRAEITRNVEKLTPGQFVEAEIVLSNETPTKGMVKQYALPKNALTRQDKDTYIFVQNAKGFLPIKVDVISDQTDKVIVTSKTPNALKGDELIASAGTVEIKAAMTANADGEK